MDEGLCGRPTDVVAPFEGWLKQLHVIKTLGYAPFFFLSAQRFFIAALILLRAAEDKRRPLLPWLGWLLPRLAVPRKAAIAWLVLSSLVSSAVRIACVSTWAPVKN
jgi:hypothetical protein